MIFEKGADASKISEYADASGVNGAQVQKCVDDGTYAQYVQDDMAGGSAGGVSGTPGNIVLNIKTGDSRLVSGAQPVSAFQAAVDELR
jgi:protein-disulfide isomerase